MTAGGARGRRHRDDVALLGLARAASAEPEFIEGSYTCRACRQSLLIDSELDPSSLCNLCAQDAARELGEELLRVYHVIGELPPVVSAPIFEALKHGAARARAFMNEVVNTTTQFAIGKGRARRRR